MQFIMRLVFFRATFDVKTTDDFRPARGTAYLEQDPEPCSIQKYVALLYGRSRDSFTKCVSVRLQ